MLDDGKKLFKTCADQTLGDWEKLSKSELCNLYISTDDPVKKEGAVSAIIYKCWNIFNHNYRDQPYIPIEDWYDSMIEAIMYVLKQHVWTNPNNVLYDKPNGPEMALHRCIWSRKLNVYCSNNKPKRIINKNIQSIDELREKAGIDPECTINENYYIFVEYIKTLISKNKIEYSIILDLIEMGIPRNKLAREIRGLDTNYIDYFVAKYLPERETVEKIIKELQNNSKLDQYIDYYLTCLQRDSDTLDYLKF